MTTLQMRTNFGFAGIQHKKDDSTPHHKSPGPIRKLATAALLSAATACGGVNIEDTNNTAKAVYATGGTNTTDTCDFLCAPDAAPTDQATPEALNTNNQKASIKYLQQNFDKIDTNKDTILEDSELKNVKRMYGFDSRKLGAAMDYITAQSGALTFANPDDSGNLLNWFGMTKNAVNYAANQLNSGKNLSAVANDGLEQVSMYEAIQPNSDEFNKLRGNMQPALAAYYLSDNLKNQPEGTTLSFNTSNPFAPKIVYNSATGSKSSVNVGTLDPQTRVSAQWFMSHPCQFDKVANSDTQDSKISSNEFSKFLTQMDLQVNSLFIRNEIYGKGRTCVSEDEAPQTP